MTKYPPLFVSIANLHLIAPLSRSLQQIDQFASQARFFSTITNSTIKEHPDTPDRKQRKSVVFDTEAVVVEADGKVTKMASAEVAQDSAQSHAPSTPPLSDALGAFTNPHEAPVEEQTPAEDGLDLSMMKKKKKKSKKTEDADGEAAAEGADEGGLDLTVRTPFKFHILCQAQLC